MRSTPPQLRVTVVQDSPTPRDLQANAQAIERVLRESDAYVVVFPELFLSGYQIERIDELQVDLDHEIIQHLAEVCRETGRGVLFGFIEPATGAGGETIGSYNAYAAIDRDGTVLPAIRKTHLFGSEREVFVPGESIEPITLVDTRVGVINCFELEFPEVARTLALRGAEVFLTGSANMSPYFADHQIATHARALENRIPLVYANRVGTESGHAFCGGSRAISADGEVLKQLDSAERASFTVNLEIGAELDDEVLLLAQRRPELYA